MPKYLVGTGGWAYFRIPGKPSLKSYSSVFNFVEVNHTFYEYPDPRTVRRWRKTVPTEFTFAVRCHQDLTHKIGLKPLDEAYYVFGKMIYYCEELDAPFLVLETPPRYALGQEEITKAQDFLSSVKTRGVRLVWEIRAPITTAILNLMRDHNIVHSVDLSREKPGFKTDVVYSRLFGKGQHNIYQFTDEELKEIHHNAMNTGGKVVALAYHGNRMNTDAARFQHYYKTGKFLPVTSFVGTESARFLLGEDAAFPVTKSQLIEDQGWKVVDVAPNKRVRFSELLAKIPEKTYRGIDEVLTELERII